MQFNNLSKLLLLCFSASLAVGAPALAGAFLVALVFQTGLLDLDFSDDDPAQIRKNNADRQEWIDKCAEVFRSNGMSKPSARNSAISLMVLQIEMNGSEVEDWEAPVLAAHDEMRYWSDDK